MPINVFRRCLVALAVTGGLAQVLPFLVAAPISHAASFAEDWELDFQPGELRHFLDPVDGKAYWYLTYRVVNRSGAERMWAPKFEFYGDRGELLDAGRGVPPRVTKALIEKAGNQFTQDQYQILGPILVGEENAKDGLVVFPQPDRSGQQAITEIVLFVQGVSSAIRREPDPISGEERLQRRMLSMKFHVPGDPGLSPDRPADQGGIDEEIRKSPDGRSLPPVPANPRRQTDGRSWVWR